MVKYLLYLVSFAYNICLYSLMCRYKMGSTIVTKNYATSPEKYKGLSHIGLRICM